MTTWTKGEVINQAFSKIGYANYTFDLGNEQIVNALFELDNLIGMLEDNGISFGYPVTLNPSEATLTQETNIPYQDCSAVIKLLALELAPTIGKIVSPELKLAADRAYTSLTIKANQPKTMQMPGDTPAGAGNRNNRIFLTPPEDTTQIGEYEYPVTDEYDE